MIGWHVPNRQHPDAPALAVLAELLTGGRTSRLTQRLVVRDQVAGGVFAYEGPGEKYPGLFIVQGSPIAPHTTQEIETALYEEIERLQREPPTDYEMQRVRNTIEAGEVERLQSNLGLAFQLASSEAVFNDWKFTFSSSADALRVTPADVQRVARTYFSRNNRTVANLIRPVAPTPRTP